MGSILLLAIATVALDPGPRGGPGDCEAIVGDVLEILATRHGDPTTRDRAGSPEVTPGEACAGGADPRDAVERVLEPFDDPAVRLLDAAHFQRMLAEWTGEPVVGTGLTEVLSIDVDEATRRLTVIAPVPGSPAAAAGLTAGDVVTRIDGAGTDAMGLTRAMARLRPGYGEAVRLEILRNDRSREVTLEADSLPPLEAIETERLVEDGKDLLVVRLRQFTPGIAESVRGAIDEADDADAIVLDLRGNPGGLVDALVGVAGVFLEPGAEIATLVGPEPAELAAAGEAPPTDLPLAVLVDLGTASAAEALAAALAHHGRARIYGERTFGKGLAHNAVPIGETGWVLMLPVGELETPDGKRILGAGIDPDVRTKNPWTRAVREFERPAGSDRADASDCRTIAGVDPLLRPGTVVVLGEIHGTRESPAFAGAAACRALELGHPVILALEIPASEAPRIEARVGSPDDAGLDSVLEGPFWNRAGQDGRSSRAVADLIVHASELRAERGRLEVRLFDSEEEVQGQARDRWMAQALAGIVEDTPDAVVIVLTGNIHARIAKGTPWDAEFEPMTYLLKRTAPDRRIVALDVSHAGGGAWVCTGPEPADCGERELRGSSAADAGWSVRLEEEAGPRFDGVYTVGPITASPPAIAAP